MSLLAPREYTATTTLRLEPSSALVGGAVRADDLGYLDRLENTYANVARSAEVRDAVARHVGLGQRPEVNVKSIANTELMEVRVTTESPRSASSAANALAAEVVARVKALNLASADEAEKLFDTRTAGLQDEIADAENRRAELELAPSTAENRIQILRLREEITSKRASLAALVSDHQTLQLTREARAGALTIVAEATPPTGPSNRNLPLALVLSIVLGLVAGVAIAFLAENLTHRVRTGDEIERAADAPVLGTVPTTRQVADASTSGDGSRAGALRGLATTFGSDSGTPQPAAVFNSGSAGEEAFRRLATALLATATKQPFKTLLVTSADPGAGKTTVVANVGRALAQSRRAVLLVDANLRWPRLHDVYDVPNEHGLSDVLIPEKGEIVSSPENHLSASLALGAADSADRDPGPIDPAVG